MGQRSLDIVNARDINTKGIGVYVSHGFEACDLGSEIELVVTLPASLLHRVRERHRESAGALVCGVSIVIRHLLDDLTT